MTTRLHDTMNRHFTREDARAIDLRLTRVYLMESRRRGKTPFAHLLLQWASTPAGVPPVRWRSGKCPCSLTRPRTPARTNHQLWSKQHETEPA